MKTRGPVVQRFVPARGVPILPMILMAMLIATAACTPDGSPGSSAAVQDEQLPALLTSSIETPPSNWPSNGRTPGEDRFSPLDQITDGNVAELGLAWSYDTGTDRGLEATPVVIDGVMYTTGSWSVVIALDAASGEERWRFDPGVDESYDRIACCDVVNRGSCCYCGYSPCVGGDRKWRARP